MSPYSSTRRKDSLRILRAFAFGLVTALALIGMRVEMPVSAVCGVVVGLLSLLSGELATLVAVVLIAIPVAIAEPVLGIATLIVGVAAVRYFGADEGRPFVIVAATVLCAFAGPIWGPLLLAAYVLSPAEGAVAAAVACIAIEVLGIVTGQAEIGVAVAGGTEALAIFKPVVGGLLGFKWAPEVLAGLNGDGVSAIAKTFGRAADPLALVLQPVLWLFGALVVGWTKANAKKRGNQLIGLAGIAIGVAVLTFGTALVRSIAGLSPAGAGLVVAALGSLVIAVAGALVWDRFFAPVPVKAHAATTSVRLNSMAAEDADVDELLSLIATAEDKLATQHTTNCFVMITDMKSFSRMAEEEGSMLTAKAVQRHRDLLLPIVSSHHGVGKSTGGDGLVSAFESAAEALLAGVEMQRVLSEFNVSHPSERDISVRIGVASGEVVLDKSGRPFIGAALNVAARVMNLADGGQFFAAGDVVRAGKASGVQTHLHGSFELKNIAQPIDVHEVIWAEGQVAYPPAASAQAG